MRVVGSSNRADRRRIPIGPCHCWLRPAIDCQGAARAAATRGEATSWGSSSRNRRGGDWHVKRPGLPVGTHLRLPPSPLHWDLHPLLASEAISVRLGLIENAATFRRVMAISPRYLMLVVNELLRGECCRRLAVQPTKGHLTIRRPFDKFWLHLDILRLHMAPSLTTGCCWLVLAASRQQLSGCN